MAAKLKLTVLTGEYESVRALREAEATVEGVEFVFPSYPGLGEIHYQVAGGEACDIGEFNAPAYITAVSQGLPMAGIPIFLHRRFRHGFVWINTEKGITKPTDLIGRRIGEPTFIPANNVWLRGILENDYGVPHRSITWVSQNKPVVAFTPHEGLRIEYVPKGKRVNDMIVTGEIDAVIDPNPIRPIREGNPKVAHLWPNYREIELEWYKQKGIFPIMHVTTIKKELVEEHPWVVKPIMDAFEKAKRIAYKRLVNPRVVPLAWYRSYLEDERKLLGPDPWEYGLSAVNRKNLETLIGYCHQQGLTARRMTVDELFVKESLDWTPARVAE
jgi:4,5-dihydroxyphthalate decarboxylase